MAADCEVWADEVDDRGGEIVRCPECGSDNAYKVGMELRCWCLEVDDEEVSLYPGQCEKCGDTHDEDGTPDEHGNRYVPELGRCNNCAGTYDEEVK